MNYSLKGQIFAIINYIYKDVLQVLEVLPEILLGHRHIARIKLCTYGTSLMSKILFLDVSILAYFMIFFPFYGLIFCPQLSSGSRQTCKGQSMSPLPSFSFQHLSPALCPLSVSKQPVLLLLLTPSGIESQACHSLALWL
jgi:hypothetical protein